RHFTTNQCERYFSMKHLAQAGIAILTVALMGIGAGNAFAQDSAKKTPASPAPTTKKATTTAKTTKKAQQTASAKPTKKVVVNTCPITGEKVEGAGSGMSTVGNYEVHFCCGGCKPAFDKMTKDEQMKKIQAIVAKK